MSDGPEASPTAASPQWDSVRRADRIQVIQETTMTIGTGFALTWCVRRPFDSRTYMGAKAYINTYLFLQV